MGTLAVQKLTNKTTPTIVKIMPNRVKFIRIFQTSDRNKQILEPQIQTHKKSLKHQNYPSKKYIQVHLRAVVPIS
jgi:hypothetical protein